MLGWIVRYEKIFLRFPEVLSSKSILEVGSGSEGIARFVDGPVIGLEKDFVKSAHRNLKIIQGSILDSPFPEDAFDYVVCVDMLEHLASSDRAGAIEKMLAIARKKLIISCPIRDDAERCEVWLADWYVRSGGRVPWWLKEHLVNGLPCLSDMIETISRFGCQFSFFPNEGLLQHYGSILLDSLFPFTGELVEYSRTRNPVGSPLVRSEWDLSYSYIFGISKKDHKSSFLVSPASPPCVAKKEASVRIYSFFHRKPAPLCFPGLTQVACGLRAEFSPDSGEDFMDDLPASSPRLDNRRWSELSGIYRLWKEQELPSVVGLSHYRRFLLPHLAGGEHVSTKDLNAFKRYIDQIDLSFVFRRCNIDRVIYVPKPLSFDVSIYKQYVNCCNEVDLATALEITIELYPEVLPFVPCFLRSKNLYAWNICILRKEYFNELYGFVFNILLAFEKARPGLHYLPYQARDISFLAERLCHLWFEFARATKPVQLVECPIVFYR